MKVNHCIRNLLRLICLLQKNAKNDAHLEDGCTKPFLGPAITTHCFNTRVITLYSKDGSIFTTNFLDKEGNVQTSSFFRVEKVFDDCATFLILKKKDDNYFSTGQAVTVKLSCICAIKCVTDVGIDNL